MTGLTRENVKLIDNNVEHQHLKQVLTDAWLGGSKVALSRSETLLRSETSSL